MRKRRDSQYSLIEGVLDQKALICGLSAESCIPVIQSYICEHQGPVERIKIYDSVEIIKDLVKCPGNISCQNDKKKS